VKRQLFFFHRRQVIYVNNWRTEYFVLKHYAAIKGKRDRMSKMAYKGTREDIIEQLRKEYFSFKNSHGWTFVTSMIPTVLDYFRDV